MNKFTKDDYKNAAKVSFSIAGMCRYLNLAPKGGNYSTIKKYIKEYEIDTSHFTGKGWNVGLKFKPHPQFNMEEILVKNKTYNTNKLRKRLIDEGYKEYKCECCGNTEWMGKPIPLELHHINGDRNDNRLENLQILCPNCHSFTENYRGSNKKKYKISVPADEKSLDLKVTSELDDEEDSKLVHTKLGSSGTSTIVKIGDYEVEIYREEKSKKESKSNSNEKKQKKNSSKKEKSSKNSSQSDLDVKKSDKTKKDDESDFISKIEESNTNDSDIESSENNEKKNNKIKIIAISIGLLISISTIIFLRIRRKKISHKSEKSNSDE